MIYSSSVFYFFSVYRSALWNTSLSGLCRLNCIFCMSVSAVVSLGTICLHAVGLIASNQVNDEYDVNMIQVKISKVPSATAEETLCARRRTVFCRWRPTASARDDTEPTTCGSISAVSPPPSASESIRCSAGAVVRAEVATRNHRRLLHQSIDLHSSQCRTAVRTLL